jgi:hypothetical protein
VLLDAQGLRARQSLPGDARRSQVVEGDVLGRGRVLEEVGAGDAGSPKVLAEVRGEVFERRKAVARILVRMIVLHD